MGPGHSKAGTSGIASDSFEGAPQIHAVSLFPLVSDGRGIPIHCRSVLPLPTYRFARRLGQLLPGLALFGIGVALMVRADLGLSPWQAFHQGVAARLGLAIGTVVILTGIVVLLAWIPLRERFGLGTILNVALIGNVLNATLLVLPDDFGPLPCRLLAMTSGVLLIGLGSGFYIGAGMGPGPRDGLMTGLARRGMHIGAVRTGIEISVLAIGWLLGGTVGLGTVTFALAIGPLVAVFLPRFTVSLPAEKETTPSLVARRSAS